MHFRHGLFPGSFDPITEGHIDIIRRACAICDCVTVGVFVNSEKSCLFSIEERVAKIKEALADLPQVSVVSSTGYTHAFATSNGCDVLLRGYRNKTDLAYEYDMAVYNFTHGHIPTYLFPAAPHLKHVSSTLIRKKILSGKEK